MTATSIGVVLGKYWVFVAKTATVMLALVAGPGMSAQAGHGDAHATATPAHGSSSESHGDSHAAPAATATPAAHDEAHGEGTAAGHDAAAGHGDSAAAHGETTHDAAAAGEHGAAEGHQDAHGETAEHGGEHGGGEHHEVGAWGEPLWFGIPSGIWHLINFVILFGAIGFAVRKGLVASIRKKREDTARGIEEATKLREEMRKKFEEYDARMKNIDANMAAIVSDAKQEAELEKSKMVADATALGQRIREDAKLIADQEIARAKRELQDEQIARAAELAEGLLRANVTKEDQARLADEFMSRVGERKEGRA